MRPLRHPSGPVPSAEAPGRGPVHCRGAPARGDVAATAAGCREPFLCRLTSPHSALRALLFPAGPRHREGRLVGRGWPQERRPKPGLPAAALNSARQGPGSVGLGGTCTSDEVPGRLLVLPGTGQGEGSVAGVRRTAPLITFGR